MRIGIPLLVSATLIALVCVQAPSVSGSDAGTFKIDPLYSTLVFRIKHLDVAAFYGRFNAVKGSFTLDDEGKGSVEVKVKAVDVDTGATRRDEHVRGPDCFSAKQFPLITFKSDQLKKLEGSRYEAKGTFTMHGVSKEITVQLDRLGTTEKWILGGHRTGFEGSFTIKRSDFGMKWRLDVLGDEVKIIVAIQGVRR